MPLSQESHRDLAPLLSMRGICKHFPGVQALDGVDLQLETGEVLGLLGVNGAGKSTLMNVLGGVVKPDAGEIRVQGRPLTAHHPRESSQAGVAFVHQELSLYPNLSLAENILLPELPHRIGFYRSRVANTKARTALDRVGLEHRTTSELLEQLPPGERQLVEIARALSRDVRILILDEPTSSLTSREVDRLFCIVRKIKAEGVGVIFLSHRMEEVTDICDRVVVLRDRRVAAVLDARTTPHEEFVFHMLGRKMPVEPRLEAKQRRGSPSPLLRVRDLSFRNKLNGISFEVWPGEIVGIAGLLGSGRTELLRCIFGLERVRGNLFIEGVQQNIRNPSQAVASGLALVTEDRRQDGLLIEHSVKENIVLASHRANANGFGVMRTASETRAATAACERLRIRAHSTNQIVATLSGGNQQKVVIAKWLQNSPRILLLDEPTRGVDVGAKEDIYELISEVAARGAGVVFVSSELNELLRVCHRILVLRDGRISEEFAGVDVTEHAVLRAAAGGLN